jgi:hypothetical protein
MLMCAQVRIKRTVDKTSGIVAYVKSIGRHYYSSVHIHGIAEDKMCATLKNVQMKQHNLQNVLVQVKATTVLTKVSPGFSY